ncbi:hypothetical protein [Nibrella saemangeumensis]
MLSVYVALNYRQVKREYRYFLRDNYFNRLYQVRYLLRDYFIKKHYKVIDYQGEFQNEITHVLPFAYWHYLNGTLEKTISCKGTNELYFFSPDHEERYAERRWDFTYNNYNFPNINHSIKKTFKKWIAPPLKEQYKNTLFVFDKPILIIANKYNIEWNQEPTNFLDIPTLDRIINLNKHKYQIIYNRPLPNHIVQDNSEILDLNEYPWLQRAHPEVILLNDLFTKFKSKVNSFNHLQLMVYANCDRFVSVHGGTAALASYFGGKNIILSNGGLESVFDEYTNYFPRLSNALILHAKTPDDVFSYLSEEF